MKHIKKQLGQSATEYIITLIVVMMILGVGFANEGSVITIFLDAVREGFERYSGFLSLP
ncbi:hypothetical protein [Methylotenera sp. N17]|uniref:hypothetical protein n=1 Tax=Methylotenera sp. N17 TaxID=1502761 RepID=UPI000A509D6B|nr:hypothetical protein [Methylotenera sp. N17]